jgi:hypothetical protein
MQIAEEACYVLCAIRKLNIAKGIKDTEKGPGARQAAGHFRGSTMS